VIVTAEYNHSVPGQLKNAIDSVFVSFALRNKPIAFVGYSGGIGAGIRAVEHLALTNSDSQTGLVQR
jgi:NAD(P)H-dependent FMN reductase